MSNLYIKKIDKIESQNAQHIFHVHMFLTSLRK